MTRVVVAVLVIAVVLAGCAGPGGGEDEPTVGTGTTDNDYGAEPINPPNGTGTEDIAETPGDSASENGTGTTNGT